MICSLNGETAKPDKWKSAASRKPALVEMDFHWPGRLAKSDHHHAIERFL
jgi:hypothetical protein